MNLKEAGRAFLTIPFLSLDQMAEVNKTEQDWFFDKLLRKKNRSASILKLFHDHNKRIGYNTSAHMASVVDNHPFYLKLLVWHCLIRSGSTCSKTNVRKALRDLIHHFDHRFYKIVENLTPKQISFLKALVKGNQKLYSKAIRDEYQLGSTSNIARIKKSLERKEIINTGRMETGFTDPIFREWLRINYFNDQAGSQS
jgi:hypothetical protein